MQRFFTHAIEFMPILLLGVKLTILVTIASLRDCIVAMSTLAPETVMPCGSR